MQKTKEIPRVELLAPVGKWDVLEAVIRAGADAVYLGGKKFNMRLHRKEFNFTREQMRDAAVYCHEKGVKIYVTVNNMLTDAETAEIPDYLSYLQKIAVDGLIVQDLGVVRWAKKMGLTVPLHGSVMMNVHNLESIQLLEELGLTRVILGRELTLDDIKLIHNKTSLELEYFTHGDMCFSQSSQCYHSGMLFGKSSNRGQCLKPCRWAFELVDRETDEVIPVQVPGHYFMAVKDITLLPFLPDVIDSGICSLKLEGRMRQADFLEPLVGFYRRALDQYYKNPVGYTFDWNEFQQFQEIKVRDLSPLYSFGNPGAESIDYTGEREPRFFSRAVKEPTISEDNWKSSPLASPSCAVNKDKPLLSVKVGSKTAALKALENGADLVYTSGESFLSQDKPWEIADFAEILDRAKGLGKKVVAGFPRIVMPHEMDRTFYFLEKIKDYDIDGLLVTNLGTIYTAAKSTDLPLYADYSCNIANQAAAELFKDYQVIQVTASIELHWEEIMTMTGKELPVEAVIHGNLPSMVTEHCLPAALLEGTTRAQLCSGICRKRPYGLKDTAGKVHSVEIDQNCRNHIYMANELALLPYLYSFYGAGFASLRLEIPLYKADEAGAVTKLYRQEIDGLWDDPTDYAFSESSWQELLKVKPVAFGTGPYTTGERVKHY
ncbi:MAG: U32 family peptidase [Syntrophaceticus sp.]|nr:U32 family peptidase [Syntrophaceticus sp.]